MGTVAVTYEDKGGGGGTCMTGLLSIPYLNTVTHVGEIALYIP